MEFVADHHHFCIGGKSLRNGGKENHGIASRRNQDIVSIFIPDYHQHFVAVFCVVGQFAIRTV